MDAASISPQGVSQLPPASLDPRPASRSDPLSFQINVYTGSQIAFTLSEWSLSPVALWLFWT